MNPHAAHDAPSGVPVLRPLREMRQDTRDADAARAGAAATFGKTTTGPERPALPYRAILCCGFDADSIGRPARGAPAGTTTSS
jgi:hypothetical protein